MTTNNDILPISETRGLTYNIRVDMDGSVFVNETKIEGIDPKVALLVAALGTIVEGQYSKTDAVAKKLLELNGRNGEV